ncbi:fumarylacetoacetate hydrolase family protein [Nitratireductor soli]|uniref:fumarylacetoacetate hydrolase family protein n=1 Tax=Nitratireductor soli TaxID=1670619 RepID=UPI00065E04D5|nr:fumarylacetoacetate hydrolase family protein [Nitratireductor soli]
MKLVTFRQGGKSSVGVQIGEEVRRLDELVPGAPQDMLGVIDAGAALLDQADEALRQGRGQSYALSDVRLLAPIPLPRRNVLCVGKNYHEHAAEFANSGYDSSSGGQDIPDVPIVFSKFPETVIGPNANIEGGLDRDGTLDYEGELAVVIGRAGREIASEAALAHVFGYTIVNDVTARAAQKRHKQWFLGKSCDTFCPMGPSIITAAAVPDVTKLRLRTWVNNELRQDASVRDLIFDIPTIIATISRSISLKPGDIIATGTPAGVGIGFDPPRYLAAGDKVTIEIPEIGTLTNRVV